MVKTHSDRKIRHIAGLLLLGLAGLIFSPAHADQIFTGTAHFERTLGSHYHAGTFPIILRENDLGRPLSLIADDYRPGRFAMYFESRQRYTLLAYVGAEIFGTFRIHVSTKNLHFYSDTYQVPRIISLFTVRLRKDSARQVSLTLGLTEYFNYQINAYRLRATLHRRVAQNR